MTSPIPQLYITLIMGALGQLGGTTLWDNGWDKVGHFGITPGQRHKMLSQGGGKAEVGQGWDNHNPWSEAYLVGTPPR